MKAMKARDDSSLFPKLSTLIDILNFRAFNQPEQVAYTFLSNDGKQEKYLTYKQLTNRCQLIASSLQNKGYKAKERALLLYPPGIEYIAAFFGCMYAGLIPVPVYPPRPNRSLSRLQSVIVDVEAKLALTNTNVLSNVKQNFERFPNFKNLFWVATDELPKNVDTLNSNLPVIKDNDLALIQYTSGSTGKPKGVIITHQNIIHNSALIYRCFGHSFASVGVSWLPAYHDMGLIGGIVQPLYAGFPVTLLSPTDFIRQPLLWLKTISECKATTSGAPNFAYEMCLNKIKTEDKKNLDLSCWDLAFVGAEPIRAETLNNFAEAFAECGFKKSAFYPCYGMAEATLIVSGGIKQELPVVKESSHLSGKNIVSCGKTSLGQEVKIVDSNNELCAEKEIGEIWIKNNNCIAKGYWNKDKINKKTFKAKILGDESYYLKTGDLGFIEQNELFITGRAKDVIIIRGKNYYPDDIEKTAEQSHNALKADSSAAFGIRLEGEDRLVIVQEVKRTYLKKLGIVKSNKELSTKNYLEEVKSAIRSSIYNEYGLRVYAVQLIKTHTIFKTSSGKIQRFLCKQNYLNNFDLSEIDRKNLSSEISIPSQVNTKEIEVWLSNWLSNRLQIPIQQIDRDKPFAEQGIDSVMAVELAQELQEWLPYSLDIESNLTWNFPSINAVANYLSSNNELSSSPQYKEKNFEPVEKLDLSELSEEELMRSLAAEIALAKEEKSS